MGMGAEMLDRWILIESIVDDRIKSNLDNEVWETRDGRILKITEMSDGHLINTWKFLDKNKHHWVSDSYIKLIKNELKARGFVVNA